MKLLLSCLWAIAPVAALLSLSTLAEYLWPREAFRLADRFPGALFTCLTPALVVLVTYPLHALWGLAGVPLVLDLSRLGLLAAPALLLLYDLLRYVEHRVEHRIWWPVHAVHHAETKLNSANSYSHPLMAVPEFFIVVVPLSYVMQSWYGYAVAAIMAFQNLIIHSPLKLHLGPLRHLIVDSRFHRIHHSVEPRHFDRNFGLVFTIWDRLFGTAWFPADDEWPDTGVAGLTAPARLDHYLLQPLQHFRSHTDADAATGRGSSL